MKPKIDGTTFGSIIVAGAPYSHDVVISLNGKVARRKKELSKRLFGTSHIISLAEAEDAYEEGAQQIIIGTGQSGMAKLSPEAAAFFEKRGCTVQLLPTPDAVRRWNEVEGPALGLFHITC